MKLREYALVMYKNQPALIKTVTADKFDIDTPSGTKKVRDKDITLLHAGPVANLSKVQNYPLPEADVREAHTFFDGDNPSLRDIADLLWGDLPPEAWWSVWKTVSESPWFIAESPESPITLRPESQAQAIIAKAQAKKEEGTPTHIAAHLQATRANAQKPKFAKELQFCLHTRAKLLLLSF
jgi:exoribonuclease-2